MQPIQDLYILTRKSGNRKTGPIPVSTSNLNTCPPSCALKKGCYARYGRMWLIWVKLCSGKLTNGVMWSDFLKQVRDLDEDCTIWRHNQAGDLPGRNNRLHKGKCIALAKANVAGGRNRRGYTYTHYPVLPTPGVKDSVVRHNRDVVYEMNGLGFTVNLSAHNMRVADEMYSLGIAPVVMVLPSDTKVSRMETPKGRTIRVCPAILDDDKHCDNCFVCAYDYRRTIIGFPAHGTGTKYVDPIARGEIDPHTCTR